MQEGRVAEFRQRVLRWRYRELPITADGTFVGGFDPGHLHVWPRGDHLMFALPNRDRSFNGVYVFPEGDSPAQFGDRFGDVLDYIPDLATRLTDGQPAGLWTTSTFPWHYRDKVVLIGDACHTVLPFYGQGMNAGFEDCAVLDDGLRRHRRLEDAFERYQSLRKANTDALATLSLDNFDELRDTIRRPITIAGKQVMLGVNAMLGERAMPLYTMISHTTIPYAECVSRAKRQRRIAGWLGIDLLIYCVTAIVALNRAARLGHVSPAIKYTLARLGLFAVTLIALLPIPNLDILLKLMIAVLVSAVASWFLLRRMREQMADRIEESMQRRREEKEKLRTALAGEDKDDKTVG